MRTAQDLFGGLECVRKPVDNPSYECRVVVLGCIDRLTAVLWATATVVHHARDLLHFWKGVLEKGTENTAPAI